MNYMHDGVVLSPDEARKVDDWLFERYVHSDPDMQAAIQSLRDELAPAHQPALGFDMERFTPDWYRPGWEREA